MSTAVTTTTIPFTKSEALNTRGGPLPAGVAPEGYAELLVTVDEDGLQELTPRECDIITQVIDHQKSVSVGTPSPQPAQKRVEDTQPDR